MTMDATAREPVLVDLALQGGGSHGAFTWGVLDRLIEEPWAADRRDLRHVGGRDERGCVWTTMVSGDRRTRAFSDRRRETVLMHYTKHPAGPDP
jgi:hypothetical protein